MTTAALGQRLPAAFTATVAGAWLLAAGAQAAGFGTLLHHDALAGQGLAAWVALPLFLLAWQVMIAAMMLPSSLPLIRLFAAAARRQAGPRTVMAAFLAGYALVWTLFGALAFTGDVGVHQLVDRSPWLQSRQWLIAGGILAAAGAFQFSSLKKRCLTECRHPASFLAANYGRGPAAAFRLGRKHGLFCLGCCFALMLLMFAAGVTNLLWMATLTALMVYEKAGRAGGRLVRVAGVALLGWAAVVLAAPLWQSVLLGSAP